jgi:Kef-type K+ transport system membrane component KefB
VLLLLLLQIAIILALARVTASILTKLGQPRVVGEMIAGLLLGPSCLGWALPRLSAAVFSPSSLAPLNALSQFGLVVFMFLVGLGLDVEHVRSARGIAITTSIVSIAVPFALGTVVALNLYSQLAPPAVPRLPFALFVGVALSITAFPVLVRILSDHGLSTTRLGSLAIACAAVDDVTGWLILVVLTALVRAGNAYLVGLQTLGLFVLYLMVMVAVVRPAFRRVASRPRPASDFALVVLVMVVSALATEAIGIHVLFGAFFAGSMLPRNAPVARVFRRRIEPIIVTLFLPIFFAFTGLRTSVRLVDSAALWADFGLILLVAVAGKAGAAAIAARLVGLTWRDATALGILLNTRGLVELVVLNIGLDLGILSRVMFSLLVLMALVTTGMTSPLLRWCRVSS